MTHILIAWMLFIILLAWMFTFALLAIRFDTEKNSELEEPSISTGPLPLTATPSLSQMAVASAESASVGAQAQ